jgi:hypothetical protein
MSIGERTGRVMFSVFENSGTTSTAWTWRTPGGRPWTDACRRSRGPPCCRRWRRSARAVSRVPADPLTGLPETRQFAARDYRSRIGLDFIGPPSFGVGVSEFGAGIAGGISFYFSDMLGDNQIGAVVQANGTFKDIGGQVQYVKCARRWNWGGSAATSRT